MKLTCEGTREDMVRSLFMNGTMGFGVLDEFSGDQESCIQTAVVFQANQGRAARKERRRPI